MAAIQMGIGTIGDSNIGFKRKYQWTFGITFLNGSTSVPPSFVKVAGRPNLQIEETTIDYLNGKTWIPGKGTWQTITVTYQDVIAADNLPLFSWIATIYDFISGPGFSAQLNQASLRQDWAGIGTLTMLDGGGNTIEIWTLNDCFPTSINFGDLDYASSDICTIELTLRYSTVGYNNVCFTGIKPVFTPACSGSTGQVIQ